MKDATQIFQRYADNPIFACEGTIPASRNSTIPRLFNLATKPFC